MAGCTTTSTSSSSVADTGAATLRLVVVAAVLALTPLRAASASSADEPLQAGVGSRAWILEPAEADPSDQRAGSAGMSLRRGNLRFELAVAGSAQVSDLVARDDHWLVAGSRDTVAAAGRGGQDLFLIAGTNQVQKELRLPASPRSQDRSSPVVLATRSAFDGDDVGSESTMAAEAGALRSVGARGIAWLEGTRPKDHEIWFSALSDRGLEPPVRVAAAAQGSQLALRAAVHPDAGWFLVWTAFDGQDDEVLWSRGARDDQGRAVWLPPQRVSADNTVPDIAPAIAVLDDQVVLVWSQYDGNDYRLLASVFRSGSWSEPTRLGGPGSLYPRFLAHDTTPLLLYYDAAPRNWQVLELEARSSGRVEARRSATLDRSGVEQPVIESVDDNGVRASWRYLERSNASRRGIAASTEPERFVAWRPPAP